MVSKIKQDVKKVDNIIDIGNNESINFNDIINSSKDIMNGKINNSNEEKNIMKNLKILKKI